MQSVPHGLGGPLPSLAMRGIRIAFNMLWCQVYNFHSVLVMPGLLVTEVDAAVSQAPRSRSHPVVKLEWLGSATTSGSMEQICLQNAVQIVKIRCEAQEKTLVQ